VVIGTANAGRQQTELQGLVGCLINMLVLRVDLADDPTFDEATRRTMNRLAQAWEHQSAPFERIIDRLALPRDPSRNPLFQIAIDLQRGDSFTWTWPGLQCELISTSPQTSRFDMAVNSYEGSDGLRFRIEYATDLFDRERVQRLFSHFEQVLRAAVADSSVRVSALPLLGGSERAEILQQWQGPKVVQSADPVHVQISAVASAYPQAVAARLGEVELSYAELERRSALLARRLRQLGVGREDVVAVALERGPELLVALVATLKAGGAFVVMDTTHPPQRLAFILADTAAKVVITDSVLRQRLPEAEGWTALSVDTDWAQVEAADGTPLPELADVDSMAYVLYTSGSTGKPKGVMIEHHALTTFIIWLTGVFNFGPGSRNAHHMALIFDFAIGEIFAALASGATLVFVPEEARLDPEAFGALLVNERISYLGGPPAVLGTLPPRDYPHLKYMIAGGEAVPADLANRWNTNGRRFVNGYGPTEAAVGCIFYECPPGQNFTNQPPIGRAMPNRYAYLLDRHDNLCPVGIPGEVVVGGAGLARGYLNLPELTAEKFIADPIQEGGRIYRTGDLGMWNTQGQIEFLGRIDTQVKLNGLRIELEEIESALTNHPHVAAAAVIVREDTPGNKQLVGYIVPTSPNNGGIDTTNLRNHLADQLPRYMIPNILVTLPTLPLTSIGKIDRTALPEPGHDTTTTRRAPKPPRTPTEQKVATTFANILNLQRISTDDNFFALGGTSLQAARAVLELSRACGIDIAVGDFYSASDAGQVADVIDQAIEARAAKAADEQRLADDIADLERRLAQARAAATNEAAPTDAAPTDAAPTNAVPSDAAPEHDSATSPAEGGHRHG
jgi:amino acid adenylation domain-containing protein